MVDPNHLIQNEVAPPVQITATLANGRRVQSGSGKLQLSSSERNLEIRYAGLSFISPEKVTFEYILDGYEKSWTDARSRREAFFTNLPPGHFRFRVRTRNADGIWSTQPAVLRLEVEPRFYQRLWFFPLLAILLGALVFLVLCFRSSLTAESHGQILE
jgi:hypothetical protein